MLKNIVSSKSLKISILTVLIPAAMQIFYVRFISYNVDSGVYGSFVIYLSLTALISTLLYSIPFAALTRYINETSNKKIFIDEFITILYLLLIPGVLVFCVFLYFYDVGIWESIILIGYFLLVNRVSLNKIIIFQLIKRKKFLYFSVFEKVAKFIFPLIVYYVYESVTSLLAGVFIGYLLLSIYTSYETGTIKWKYSLSTRKIKIFFFYAYPVIFTALASWVISLSDRFFIEYFLNTSEIGVYSVLSHFAGLGSMFGSIFTVYAQPIIYKGFSEDENGAIKKYIKYIKIMAVIFVMLYLVFLFVPKNLFTILIKPEVINNDEYLFTFYILFLSSIFGVMVTIASHFFHLYKVMYLLTFFWCFGAVVNIIGNMFIGEYGLIAAAMSTTVSYMTIILCSALWLVKNISYK